MCFYKYLNNINRKERYLICGLLTLIFLLCSLLLIEKFKLIPESAKIKLNTSSKYLNKNEKEEFTKNIEKLKEKGNFKLD